MESQYIEVSNDDMDSKLNEIIEHIQKPKKLVLPKSFLRCRNVHVDCSDIQDNLSADPIGNDEIEINNTGTNAKETNVEVTDRNTFPPSKDVKKDARKNKKTKDNEETRTRNPTAYNIFVKETVIKLQDTHKHLTPKERFKLAIAMWNENKVSKHQD